MVCARSNLEVSSRIYTKEIKALVKSEKMQRVVIFGNPVRGWQLLFEVSGKFCWLHSTGSNSIRLIKTHLSLYKLLKRFNLKAKFIEMELSMTKCKLSLLSLFIAAQLDLTPETKSLASDDIIFDYIAVVQSGDGEITVADVRTSIEEFLTDPALFTAQLNAQLQLVTSIDKTLLNKNCNDLGAMGSLSTHYKLFVDSIRLNLS